MADGRTVKREVVRYVRDTDSLLKYKKTNVAAFQDDVIIRNQTKCINTLMTS